MKPFDYKAAEAGASICTRDGREARIISIDAENAEHANIVALVRDVHGEHPYMYYKDGKSIDGCEIDDLFMKSEKHEGWINVYACSGAESCNNSPFYGGYIYSSQSEALSRIELDEDLRHLKAVKICWEE